MGLECLLSPCCVACTWDTFYSEGNCSEFKGTIVSTAETGIGTMESNIKDEKSYERKTLRLFPSSGDKAAVFSCGLHGAPMSIKKNLELITRC